MTFNPGLVASSTQLDYKPEPLGATLAGKNNIIAPDGIASGDLRTLTVQQLEDTRAKMRKVVAASLPQTSAEIDSPTAIRPWRRPTAIANCCRMYDAVSRDLGFGPVTEVNPRNAGAADISFAADHVDMALDGLGLLGGGSHTPDEFADLRTYQDSDAAVGGVVVSAWAGEEVVACGGCRGPMSCQDRAPAATTLSRGA